MLRECLLRCIGSGGPRRIVAAKVLREMRDVTVSVIVHAELDEMVNTGVLSEGRDHGVYDWLAPLK